jgi:hypothetical protein
VASKVERTAVRGARDKAARERVAARRQAARRKRVLIAAAGVSLVALIAVALILVRPQPAAPAPTLPTGTAAQDATVTRALASVPASAFDSVGPGTAAGLSPISGPPLTADGKPEVV